MRSLLARLCALGACVCLNACGSSNANFYDATSGGSGSVSSGSGPSITSGGADPNANAGAASMGTSGSSSLSNGGQASGGGAGSNNNPSNAPCGPVKDVSGGASGALGTTGPACLRVTGAIAGWGCSNFDGRMLKVNGQSVMCGELPLPDPIDGAYYFDISAGTFDYASFYWF
jgi:endoglucanase